MPGRTAVPPPPPARRPPRVLSWRLRRNPLRRRSDLVQGWIGLALLLTASAATPAAVVLAADAAHDRATRTARQQAQTRHETTATLLENARRHPEPGSAEARGTRYPAQVRYTDPQGRPRTATTDVPPSLPRGSTLRVWVGTDGQLTDPPLTPDQIRNRVRGSAIIAALGVPAASIAAYGVTSRVVQRRQLAAWDRAWADTAPRWTAAP
ncbi:Rv1733c family protein [Streptomyces griseosporeus]|uniref:Rv1733c family protein n=1 Tax=Streptomyces griseosporeus TaxID=1910 RepID=UPI003686AADB